ncbi:hypothetical protein GCM10017687_24710 [Streptomyces echinatus]
MSRLRLGRSHWGEGPGTPRRLRALCTVRIRETGLERIVSIALTVRGNDASERIMRKLGMHPAR